MKIAVVKTVHIAPAALREKGLEHQYYGVAVMDVNTAYCREKGPDLIQIYASLVGSDTSGRYYQRFSADNGRSWSEPTVLYEAKKNGAGVVRWHEGCLFLDEEKNALLHFNDYSFYPSGHFSKDALHFARILMRLSFDGGRTFGGPEQIIEEGHDEIHWAEGVKYGENQMIISFAAPFKTSTGRILLPVTRLPNPDGYPDPWCLPEEAGCFIGEWRGDKLQWRLSRMVGIDPKLSSRGLCEPTFAELADGTLLMVMRGSNTSITHLPGYKWQARSSDSGYTWTEAEPWTYETNGNFFSPATGSRLIRHSVSGRLYWIGNISPVNPDGNQPRFPLLIAEVGRQSGLPIETETAVIDDRQETETEAVQLSNFRVYEDRQTHEFVLNMARIFERGGKDLTSPSYQYRIRIRD